MYPEGDIEVGLDTFQDSRPEDVVTITAYLGRNQNLSIGMSTAQARTLRSLLDLVLAAKQAPVRYRMNQFGRRMT